MVVMKEGVKESSLKRRRQHDLPTPESPIRSNFIFQRFMISDGRPMGQETMDRCKRKLATYQKIVIPGGGHDTVAEEGQRAGFGEEGIWVLAMSWGRLQGDGMAPFEGPWLPSV